MNKFHKRNTGTVDSCACQMATLGPAGRMKYAPGTWGSAVAALAAPFLFMPLPLVGRLIVLAIILVVGTWCASRTEKVLCCKDPGCIVIDELLGQWVTLLPFATAGWLEIGLAFAFFRAFDITKPWPIKRAEKAFPGGLGVMVDDVVAGVYAMIAMMFYFKIFFGDWLG